MEPEIHSLNSIPAGEALGLLDFVSTNSAAGFQCPLMILLAMFKHVWNSHKREKQAATK